MNYKCEYIWNVSLDKFNFLDKNDLVKIFKDLRTEIDYYRNIAIIKVIILTNNHPVSLILPDVLKYVILSEFDSIISIHLNKSNHTKVLNIIKDHITNNDPDDLKVSNCFPNIPLNNPESKLNLDDAKINFKNSNSIGADNIKQVQKVVTYNSTEWIVTYTLITLPDNEYIHKIKVADYHDHNNVVYANIRSDSRYLKRMDIMIKDLIEDLEKDLWTIEKFEDWDGDLDMMVEEVEGDDEDE